MNAGLLSHSLDLLMGRCTPPQRPQGAPVRRHELRVTELPTDQVETTHERARKRRAQVMSLLRSAGRPLSAGEIADLTLESDMDVFALLYGMEKAGRVVATRQGTSRRQRVLWSPRC